MAVTLEGQAELGGLLIGPGSPYGIKTVEGFGVSELRTSGYDRPQQDGAVAGPDYLPGRLLLCQISLRDGTSAGTIGQIADALAAKFAPLRTGSLTFDYWRPGDTAARRLYVRPRRCLIPVGYWWHHGIADDVPFELYAEDPRWYSTTEKLATLDVPASDGGRTYPRVYPLSYGANTGTSQLVSNSGNVDTWPVTTIDGPITNPRLENVTTGQTLSLSIEVADGAFLEVDHSQRTVKLNGTASRYASLLSPVQWWPLVPGINAIRLGADTSGAGAQALVSWSDANL